MPSKQEQVLAAISDAFAHRRDLSQREVAAKVGISAPYLSRILAGHHSSLSIDLLNDICEACGLELCEAIERGRCLLLGLSLPEKVEIITLDEIMAEMEKMKNDIKTLKRSNPKNVNQNE